MNDNDILTMFIYNKALLDEILMLYGEKNTHDVKSNNIGDAIIGAMDDCVKAKKKERQVLCYHERTHKDRETLKKHCNLCGDEL